MKNIRFNDAPPGEPSFSVVNNFISEKEANILLNELINFNKSFINSNSIISDKGTRLNIVNGDKYYYKLIRDSDSWSRLHCKLFDGNFFKNVFNDNLELFKKKGIKGTDYQYNDGLDDYYRFSTEFKHRLLKKISRVFFVKYFKYLLKPFMSKKIIVYPIINIAKSKTGYQVPIHTDNRYKIFVGLIYLNTIDKQFGGSTLFHSAKNSNIIEDYKRNPDVKAKNIKEVNPEAGKCVLFINSNDAYHSASTLKPGIDRYFIYFSFAVKKHESIWKTSYKVYDGGE